LPKFWHENYKTGQKQGICRVGALSGNMVFGHLITMAYPDAYDPKYREWKVEDLPIIPKVYKYIVIDDEGSKNSLKP